MPYVQDTPEPEHRFAHGQRPKTAQGKRLDAVLRETRSADAVYETVKKCLAEGRPKAALHAINGCRFGSTDVRLRNARGVCFLRLGEPQKALSTYRQNVLTSFMGLRDDAPFAAKVNFATALLLCGHVSGCVDVLGEIADEQQPAVQTLRDAIKRWESQLTWLQRLSWRVGSQPQRAVAPDFVPGELI